MGRLHVDRVFLFFSFSFDGIKYPYFDANGQQELEVVHIDCILCGAYLIPVYRHHHLLMDIQHTDSLDIFQAYYVNKYINHHAFEIAF
ncbi:hypothetical protein V8B97DRAFT_2022686 [Scleroderma yunnanense]